MVVDFSALKITSTIRGANPVPSMPASFYWNLTTVFFSKCLVRSPAKIILAMLLEVGLNRITCLASLLLESNLLGIISAFQMHQSLIAHRAGFDMESLFGN